MRKFLLAGAAILFFVSVTLAQNVFSTNDPILRYDASKPLGNAQHPNPAQPGLQKWVSTPTNGVTAGSSTIDVSSFKQYFINFKGTPMAFRIKFPKSYNNADSAAKKYPIMLFFHGAGEVGCPTNNGVYNNEKQLWLGGGLFRDFADQNKFDGFLLYPQLVNTEGCWGAWGGTTSANFNAVIGMVDSMVKYIRADIDRLLVNGLSGGGYGAWRMADAYPQRVAKIIPSASAGSTTGRSNYVHIPIWFATGGKDPDPSPAQAAYTLSRLQEIGADVRYTQYPELGHSVWYSHWREPDYAAAMNDMHKANPLVFFQRNEFCANEIINAKLGLTPGFYAYEWQKDSVTIATRTGTVNAIVLPEHVTSFTGNEITVKSFGVYRVRFKRTSTAEWSAFSMKPAVVKPKTATVTPPVTVSGAKSKLLPAPDGSTTVPLTMPSGFINYEWFNASDTSKVASTQVFNAPVGEYIARYSEQYGCGTLFSPKFTVIDANGSPKPDPVTSLTGAPASQTSIKLNWTQGANETGFEIYRGTAAGGPYKFVSLRPANTVTYTDTGITAASTCYYVMRSVNNTAASAKSNEAIAKTLADVSAPTAPSNLQYRGSTETTVLLKWNASTDNGSIKRYDIYANGEKVFSTNLTTFNVFDLDSLTSYNFIVRAVDNNDNVSPASNQVTGFTHHDGLNYNYYTTTASWTVLPNLNALTPVQTGVTDTININNTSIQTATTKFAFLWEGFIYVPVSASYTFETRSDDGSKVFIDAPYSSTVSALVNNDSVHGIRSRYGTKTLAQGYHTIAIAYYQGINGSAMELWWTNNAVLLREKIPRNFFTYQSTVVEPVPALPTTLTATAAAYNKIILTWNDNSSNETGFEIVRSLTSTGTFVPVGTAPANAVAFTDSGLTASKAYFYKIRAVTSSSESEFTTVVTATTPAAPPTPAAPTQLSAMQGANNAISLTWQDNSANETSFRIYRSTDGSTYASIGTVGANNNAFTDQNTVPPTLYYYYVAGVNASGEGLKSNIIQIKAGNSAPVISGLEDVFGKTGETVIEDFTISDDPGDNISVKILNKPAFITVQNIADSDYRITIKPTNDNVGQYTISVVATDNNGKSVTGQFAITVADNKTRSVFVNFGATGKTAPAPWNNWLGSRSAGSTITNLKDEQNVATTFSVTTVNSWSTTTVLGHLSGNNSGIVPDAVLQSGIADNGIAKVIRISGLDNTKLYNLEFVGSQNEGLAATTQYSAGNQTSVMDARYNTTASADLNNLVPDINGQILVTVTRTGTSLFSYLNALMIEEIDPAVTLLNPEHLYAEPLDRASIGLTWSDRSATESDADGFELQRARDSLFTQSVTVISLPANSTRYTDAGLTSNTKYWYRVRVKNDVDVSEYSNKFTVITPASIVYVNFNSTVPDAAFPWNNLDASPLSEFIIDNLTNQSGVSSGIRFTISKVFNGEFTAGVNTGNNSGVVPDNVLQSAYWLDNTQLCQVKLSGLNHTRRYRIGFVGSSGTPGWFKGNYTATYTINGRTVYLNSWMNSTKIVYISDIVPDASGNLLIDFSTTLAGQWAFNSGIIIQEYTDTKGGSILYMSNSEVDTSGRNSPIQPQVNYKVRVYPNPFTGFMNLDFYNPSNANRISAEVYDLNGRLIYRQNFGNISAGSNTLRISPLQGAHRSGMYIVMLRINGKMVQSVKMLRGR
jgi:fibronectin type 3 domain-containing protein/dienelactone hydrolase